MEFSFKMEQQIKILSCLWVSSEIKKQIDNAIVQAGIKHGCYYDLVERLLVEWVDDVREPYYQSLVLKMKKIS